MKTRLISSFIGTLICVPVVCQEAATFVRNACVEEVLKCEEKSKTILQNNSEDGKTPVQRYTVKATNWDNEISVSNVTLYREQGRTNLFCEQVRIYQDENHALLILPLQKLIVLNQLSPEVVQRNFDGGLTELRASFLDSCKVLKCEIAADKSRKVLTLKNTNAYEGIQSNISTVTYVFNPEVSQILSIRITYNSRSPIKQLDLTYRTYADVTDYRFPSLNRIVTDRRGRLLAKFSDYELVDNREAMADDEDNTGVNIQFNSPKKRN